MRLAVKSAGATTFVTAFVAGLFALAGGFVGAYTTSTLNYRNQLKTETLHKRQQAYAEIMGRKFLLTQLYFSRFEARVFSDYHERRWNLSGNLPNSLDLSEAQRWMHKSEDLALDIAKTNQSLFESIGMAKTSFRRGAALDTLTQRIYQFRTPSIVGPPDTKNVQDLEIWKAKAVTQLQQLVEEEYARPIDALLEYLQAHISDDQS
jgi:hypothetical protein